jgi:hypothetical protein
MICGDPVIQTGTRANGLPMFVNTCSRWEALRQLYPNPKSTALGDAAKVESVEQPSTVTLLTLFNIMTDLSAIDTLPASSLHHFKVNSGRLSYGKARNGSTEAYNRLLRSS